MTLDGKLRDASRLVRVATDQARFTSKVPGYRRPQRLSGPAVAWVGGVSMLVLVGIPAFLMAPGRAPSPGSGSSVLVYEPDPTTSTSVDPSTTTSPQSTQTDIDGVTSMPATSLTVDDLPILGLDAPHWKVGLAEEWDINHQAQTEDVQAAIASGEEVETSGPMRMTTYFLLDDSGSLAATFILSVFGEAWWPFVDEEYPVWDEENQTWYTPGPGMMEEYEVRGHRARLFEFAGEDFWMGWRESDQVVVIASVRADSGAIAFTREQVIDLTRSIGELTPNQWVGLLAQPPYWPPAAVSPRP